MRYQWQGKSFSLLAHKCYNCIIFIHPRWYRIYNQYYRRKFHVHARKIASQQTKNRRAGLHNAVYTARRIMAAERHDR